MAWMQVHSSYSFWERTCTCMHTPSKSCALRCSPHSPFAPLSLELGSSGQSVRGGGGLLAFAAPPSRPATNRLHTPRGAVRGA
eukprot:8874422-Alexandrium_andersonii.AAC.1